MGELKTTEDVAVWLACLASSVDFADGVVEIDEGGYGAFILTVGNKNFLVSVHDWE